jgi:hypothetical protein
MDTHEIAPVLVDHEAKIRATALDYIAGVLENNPDLMESSLHPDLAKRAYLPGLDGKPELSQMSALSLIRRVGLPGRKPDPGRHAEVMILDRYEGSASVRITFDAWVDFLHIVNVGDEWKIVNVLWELTPEQWAAKGGRRAERASSQDDDLAKIRAAALDYIGGCLEADPVRMERCLHPDLAKRAILPSVGGKPQMTHISSLALIRFVQTFAVDPSRHAEVVILDRYEGAASVRTTFDTWVDFLHIVNVDNEWKIINVLWEITPERWAAKSGMPRSSEPIWPFPR